MAKQKSKKKTTRRRKIGASKLNGNSMLVKIGSIAVGYLMADKINAPIVKAVGDKVDGKVVGAAEAGIGAFLVFGKGPKKLFKTVIGGVLMGAGGKKLMSEFGIGGIGGAYGNVKVIGAPRRINGPYGNVKVVGQSAAPGYSPNASLNGYTPNHSLNGRKKMMAGAGLY